VPERPEAAVGADSAGWGWASVMDFRATVSGMRMQARQYVGNPEERKHHDSETQNGEISGSAPKCYAFQSFLQ
jgi:hypothetical protein